MARKVPAKWIRNASDRLAIEQGCWFDLQAANDAVEFIETFCKQSKGRWAGQALKLLEWQRDFIMRLFGWKRPDGTRRFRRAYLEVAKKNGKSTMISALCLLLCLADGEGAPEVYINACDRQQASIVFDEAMRMVQASPALSKRLEIVASKKRIVDPAGHGTIIANSADVPSKDGVNAHGIIFDELHRQKTRQLWDIFEYAAASRDQPLTISITTAGEACEGVWHEQREYSEKVNAGVIADISHLGVVYRALETDDLDSVETWKKANPSLGHTIKEADFRREYEEAKVVPTKLANFLRLRLNIVTRGDIAFIDIHAWDACQDGPALGSDAPAYGGLDLSKTRDLTAFVAVVGDAESGFDVHARFWLPEENIVELERQHGQPYRTWANQGLIELTPGNVIDYEFIRAEIVAWAAEHDVRRIFVDPYNATQITGTLKEKDGLPVEFLRQGFLSLSDPTKQLERLILSKRLRHGGNPILRWHASNAIADHDAADNIKLNKSKSGHKIDGMAALVNAIAAATAPDDENAGPSVYESRGVLTF